MCIRDSKNAVIQEAERLRMGEITFEDADLAGHDEPEQVWGESDSCWEPVSYTHLKVNNTENESLEAVDRPDYGRVILTLVFSLLYVALLKPLGFVISSILYLELQMCIMSQKEKRKPVKFLLISVISVMVIYFVFHNLLQLMLPNGILTGIL